MSIKFGTGVKVGGLEGLIKKLNSLGPDAIKPAVAKAAAHLKRVISVYPPQKTGRKQPFKTDKQRRFFFAALREGRIEVPYRRGQSPGSEALGRRWTIQFRDNGTSAVVGNNASYAPYVLDDEEQSHFHQEGGWKTYGQVAKQERPIIRDIMAARIGEWTNRRYG